MFDFFLMPYNILVWNGKPLSRLPDFLEDLYLHLIAHGLMI